MKRFNVQYSLETSRTKPHGVACFDLGNLLWATAQDRGPKTPYAIAFWAADQRITPPEWVEFEKPKQIGTIGNFDENAEWFQGWNGGPAKAYACTEALVQFTGEDSPRKLRVTFTWCYSTTGDGCANLPQQNGGGWVIEEIAQ